MLNSQLGWVVGDNGTILKTNNGGESWDPLNSGVSDHLKGVFFLDAEHGYACGEAGTILYTEDGGQSWTPQDSGVTTTLWRLDFVNPGFVVGGEFTGGQGVLLAMGLEGALPYRLIFPQFGDGEGFFSQIVLYHSEIEFSPQGQSTIKSSISLRRSDGTPMTVDLNGEPVEGSLELEIEPGGLVSLRTDGIGALQAGSVEVLSDRPLAGVVIFGGSFGLAGVGASALADQGLAAPFQTSQSEQIDTGLAVVNLEDEPAQLRFQLVDEAGVIQATAFSPLAANGQTAIFLSQLEWDNPVDFSELQGTVRVTSDGRIAATAIQSRPGQFATLPVTVP